VKRDPYQLTKTHHDLLVIGGGIYGVCAAWQAALRGISVCLVEKGDFGSATSGNSLKIIHGGLRYLQHLDFRRMRESIRERSLLMQIAPHLVEPIPFVIPTYGHGLRGREAHSIALHLSDLIGLGLNSRLDPRRRIPGGRALNRREMQKLCPGITDKRLTGGALWYDCLAYSTERLLFSFLLSAVRAGAAVANYLEVTGFQMQNGKVVGVKALDILTDKEITIRSRVVLNTAGPWVDDVLGLLTKQHTNRAIHLSKAFNLVTRQLFRDHAMGFQSKAKFNDIDAALRKGFSMFFIVPWQRYSLIGTKHLPYEGLPSDFRVSDADVRAFIEEINLAYPPARLKEKDIIGVYGGMLPQKQTEDGGDEVHLEKHYRLIDHEHEDGIRGLITVVGVKWTTARLVAERVLGLVCQKIGRSAGNAHRTNFRIVGGNIENLEGFLNQALQMRLPSIPEESMLHLLRSYGSDYLDILHYVRQEPSLGYPLTSSSPVIGAQIVHAVRAEMAQHIDDVLFRRTELGLASELDEEILKQCADLMARQLNWKPRLVRRELDRAQGALAQFRLG
jgi:glycerol-3-phosphate dehydrogenase